MSYFPNYLAWKAKRKGRKSDKPFDFRKAVESTLRRGRRIMEKAHEQTMSDIASDR